jgi:NAD(P)-dependent dehydrogenase (short-subunit alcohol dehydrogenase family)
MRNFKGKVAVITGGGSGIGEAMAWRFAKAGMKIVIADVDAAAAGRVQAALAAEGRHEAIAVRTDVASAADVQALADTAWQTYGSVDLLCNNAGVVPSGRFRPVWEYPVEDWKWALDVNLMGVVHGLHSFIPRMLAQGTEGHVVTTASVAGLISGAYSAVYSAAKHAAVRATEALYAALREREAPIGVTVLCPGLVNTRIYQSERNRPDELRPAGGAASETPELQAIAAQLYTGAISPAQVADQVFDAVCNDQLYLLTSTNFDEAIRDRTDAVLARRNPDFASLLELSKRDLHPAREAV